jgi:hypothetical protein
MYFHSKEFSKSTRKEDKNIAKDIAPLNEFFLFEIIFVDKFVLQKVALN